MKSCPNIKDIIIAKDWKFLVKNTLPVNIADTYSFSEAMHIIDYLIEYSSEEMIKDGFSADLMRDYSVNLMKILRAKYPHDWKNDWKNEAFLGIACALVFREEESFIHIQNAYAAMEDAPQSLILAYISAGSGPDHFLTKEQIAKLSQKAIEKGITYESALLMASLAYEQKDFEKQKYWETKASDAKRKGIHTPIINPDILKDTFKKNKAIRMKIRKKSIILFIVFKGLLIAQEDHTQDPHYEWFEEFEVAVREDGIYTSSNKGMIKLNVTEYDAFNNRYKVLCSCLKEHGLDSSEALSIQHEDSSN